MSKKLVINKDWCKGCNVCVAFCPKDVLALEGEKVVIKNEAACIYCTLCEQRCPDYAIYIDAGEKQKGG